MTVVCFWVDKSYEWDRITMLADARAAVEETPNVWKPLDDTTSKLFRLRVMSSL